MVDRLIDKFKNHCPHFPSIDVADGGHVLCDLLPPAKMSSTTCAIRTYKSIVPPADGLMRQTIFVWMA